jgi:thiol-disulfide isomerase/thioredoxin
MLSGLNTLLKKRYFKIGVEIVVVLTIYLAIKAFMQRDLVDGPVPSFEGVLLGGQSFNIQSYQGKPLLLHFWATWCSICKMEGNSIASISEDYEVITVAMNSGTDMEISAYLEEQGLSFPVVVDKNGAIAERFGVRGVPTSLIIDSNANIKFTEVGFTSELGLRLRLWLAGW